MPVKKQLTFEKSLAELETIITGLERDDCTLDDAVEKFEKGITLLRTCQAYLSHAKGKISELLQGDEGTFIEKELGLTADFLTDGNSADE
jgi:exodeoxyribonuclease VII small subunit